MNRRSADTVLAVGGAGFVGCNLVDRLARAGQRVRVYDNLSRQGVSENLAWLLRRHGDRIDPVQADIRDRPRLRAAVADASAVYHLAGQVAVTTSLADPIHDFEVNLRGTIELLEALRALPDPPPLVFTSTNKVYGCLPDLRLLESRTRWRPADRTLDQRGIGEDRGLDFRSPYGCSKGGADQYVLDYAHTFGLPATVFRMSCIYGPHQFGTEDQGWVAHFLIRAIEDGPITIFGDGKQVRDVLFVDDLVDAFLRATARIDRLAGRAFNIGGGPRCTISLTELLTLIEQLRGRAPRLERAPWRPGDQRYYVSDTSAFEALTGWVPRVGVRLGIEALYEWLLENQGAEQRAAASAADVTMKGTAIV